MSRIMLAAWLLCGICLAGSVRGADEEKNAKADEAAVSAAQGIMVGEVTDTTAIVQVRLTKSDTAVDGKYPGVPGKVRFILTNFDIQLKPTQRDIEIDWDRDTDIGVAEEEYDYIARVKFTGLKPNQSYRVRTKLEPKEGDRVNGPTAKFRTLAGAETAADYKFVVVTGMNYAKFHGDDRIDRKQHLVENNIELPAPYDGPDKDQGYPALETIVKRKPDFFVGTGDNVYYDTPDNPRAETVAELRHKWHEQFAQPRYHELFSNVPTYWEIDDHDYRIDDGDNSGDYEPSPETARRMMLEQLPLARHANKSVKTYRTHRVCKDLQVWFVENRMYRSPNSMEDGPEKTIWGKEQKEWLKKTLKESDATFKLLISPTPMVGPDDLRKTDNHTNIGGFRHERDEFFAWVKEQELDQQNFYIVCGDRHWQYHALDPSGIEEFSCGALVDANSRLGRPPGDAQSTDPEGEIHQFYTQKEPSGGFLQIEVKPGVLLKPASLRFEFCDENGETLYEHVKAGQVRLLN